MEAVQHLKPFSSFPLLAFFSSPSSSFASPSFRPSPLPSLRLPRHYLHPLNPSIALQSPRLPRRTPIVALGAASTGPVSDHPQLHLITTSKPPQFLRRIRGICFYAITAFVAIFLFLAMVAAHPFVLIFDRQRRKAHHLVAKWWAELTILWFYRVEIKGLENLPAGDTPAVYVSNHQSFLDIYTLLTLGRCFKFISKRSIFLFPVIGWAMYLLGVIPLRRMDSRSQLDCLKRCRELVKKGASVFFFPEGTRSKDGKLGAFKKGAFTVAAKTGVPVVPVTLMGTGKLMPAGMEGLVNSGTVKVVIHNPIEGTSADLLCGKARNVIADTLLLHGYKVHQND